MSEYSDRLTEPDANLREALLRRYGRVRPDGFWQRLAFQVLEDQGVDLLTALRWSPAGSPSGQGQVAPA